VAIKTRDLSLRVTKAIATNALQATSELLLTIKGLLNTVLVDITPVTGLTMIVLVVLMAINVTTIEKGATLVVISETNLPETTLLETITISTITNIRGEIDSHLMKSMAYK
jgi:hypothetical protein